MTKSFRFNTRHNHKTKANYSSNTPWITHSLLKSINKKNKLHRQYLSNSTFSHKNKYTNYKNILISLLCTLSLNRKKNNIRNTWKVINSVLNNQKSSHIISSIISDGNLINNTDQIADCLMITLMIIGPNLANNIQPSQSSPRFADYLPNPYLNSLFLTTANQIDIVNNLQSKKVLVMTKLIFLLSKILLMLPVSHLDILLIIPL